jgi:hypothetical protein
MSTAVLELQPESYSRHLLHTQERNWAETNCYVDVWIELLHAWGFEPLAAMPFTVGIDFEADQWTFFKFPLADLYDLYGLDVQELALWRPLTAHLEEQLGLGRPVLVELDSFYLPDTAGTAYRREHVKSTVAAVEIDVAGRRLGYFHGQGYYHLHDDDFVQVLRLTEGLDPAILPPYAEFVKPRWQRAPFGADLVETSLRLLRKHLSLVPESNPFTAFKARFATDLEWLATSPIEMFHAYSFATLRQFGACYELTAGYLRWLAEHGVSHLDEPRAAFQSISTAAKTLQFQLARAMARKKPLDLAPVDEMATAWTAAMDELKTRLS